VACTHVLPLLVKYIKSEWSTEPLVNINFFIEIHWVKNVHYNEGNSNLNIIYADNIPCTHVDMYLIVRAQNVNIHAWIM